MGADYASAARRCEALSIYLPAMMYRGRFAPSPTGPLHAGSLAAALASWLDARAHAGAWLIRIEDVDAPRCKREWGEAILQQLAAHGLHSDEPVLWQSSRSAAYTCALAQLAEQGWAYACTCSRKKIADYWQAQGVDKARHGDLVYPGFCRDAGLPLDAGQALRLDVGKALDAYSRARVGAENLVWIDRKLGTQSQNLLREVGDFVLRRADGCYSYQLAVVVDDAAQNISHVVRGLDLLDNTPRQILLQSAFNLPTPIYLHTPLVLAADGQKLSKQNGAAALDSRNPAQCLINLQAAAQALALPAAKAQAGQGLAAYLQSLLPLWAALYPVF